MARVVVEQVFETPMTEEELKTMGSRLDDCLEIRNGTWRRSYLSNDNLRLTCEFEAPDAESVREAMRSAGLKFERVWSATVFAVEDYPHLMSKLEKLTSK